MIVLVNIDNVRRLWYGLTVGLAVVLLSAWWIGPFVGNHQYMTDMKYGARPEGVNDSFWDMFFPLTAPLDILVTTLAIIGFVACIARRHANGTALGVIGLITVALVYLTRDSLPVIGLLWNPRLLPLIYLVRYLLMMVGVVEIVAVLVAAWRNRTMHETPGWLAGSITVGAVGLSALIVLGFMFEVLPFDGRRVFHDADEAGVRVGSVPQDGDGRRRPGRRLGPLQLPRLRGPAVLPGVLRRRADDEGDRRDRGAVAGSRGRTTRTTASTARRWR